MKKFLLVAILLCFSAAQAQYYPGRSATQTGQYVNALPGHGGYQPTFVQPVQPQFQYNQPVYQPAQQPHYYGENGGFVNPGATDVGIYGRY